MPNKKQQKRLNKAKQNLKSNRNLDFQRNHRFFATMKNLSTLLTRSLVLTKERLATIYKSKKRRKKPKNLKISVDHLPETTPTPQKKVLNLLEENFSQAAIWMSYADESFTEMSISIHEGLIELKKASTLSDAEIDEVFSHFEEAIQINESDKLDFCTNVMARLMPTFERVEIMAESNEALEINPEQTTERLNHAIELELFSRVLQFGKTLIQSTRPASLEIEETIVEIDINHPHFTKAAEHLGCQNSREELLACCVTNPAQLFCKHLDNDFQQRLGKILTKSTYVQNACVKETNPSLKETNEYQEEETVKNSPPSPKPK